MTVPVTSLYGALLALLYLGLSLNVSRHRAQTRIFLQQEKLPAPLHLAQRAQINAAEYIPLGILMLALLELSGGASLFGHVLGGTLLTGRISHATGLLGKSSGVQLFGAIATWLMLAVASVYVLVLRFQ